MKKPQRMIPLRIEHGSISWEAASPSGKTVGFSGIKTGQKILPVFEYRNLVIPKMDRVESLRRER